MCGGVHGANRLGGSSLLGCVVFGRVAGLSASRYQYSQLLNQGGSSASQRLGAIAQHLNGGVGISLVVNPNDPGRINLEINLGDGSAAGPVANAPATNASPAPAAAAEEVKKQDEPKKLAEYTLEEVAKHKTDKDCWVVVNGQVLDVTDFLSEHPGGKKAIMIYAGRDATEEFNMLHKPDVVEKYAPAAIIGTLKK